MALSLSDNEPSALVAKAHSLRGRGEFLTAAHHFNEAARNSDDSQNALMLAATCFNEANEFELADSAYKYLLIRFPLYAEGWRLYGMFLKKYRIYDKAVDALETSLSIEDDVATRNSLVISLYENQRVADAIVAGQNVLELKHRLALRNFGTRQIMQEAKKRTQIPEFDPSKPERNIISFSLWGDDPTYMEGAIINAQVSPHIYYGWKCRFYCDHSVPGEVIERLKMLGAQIAFVKDPVLLPFKPMWRFLVSDDAGVDRFVCRDADSRLNCQELIAVEEWIKSKFAFHVMRDHVYHIELILAGMWGGLARTLPSFYRAMQSLNPYSADRFSDQMYLANYIWPLIFEDTLVHDSYYRLLNSREFPDCYRLPGLIHVGGSVKLKR